MADVIGTGGVKKPATAPGDMHRTASTFDVSDRESMGDLEFVEAKVREMVKEAHDALHDGNPNDNDQVVSIISKWTKVFSASNDDYIQTLSPESQAHFLKLRGLGTNDTDPDGPLQALLAETLSRYVDAIVELSDGSIDESQCEFRIDAAIEDCTYFIAGIDNRAD